MVRARKISSIFERVFSSEATSLAFLYFLEFGAATAYDLQVHLEIPEATAYRVLKRLRELEIVEKVTKISRGQTRSGSGGPRPILWAILGTDEKQVREALVRHQRAKSPKYRAAEKWVQGFLEDFEENEIDWRQLNEMIRDHRFDYPFHPGDVTNLAARILHEKGIKVWM